MSDKVNIGFTCGGLALGVVLWLVSPKSQAAVLAALLIVFGLLAIPVWNLPWIEMSYGRRLAALLMLAGLVVMLGDYVWPGRERVLVDKTKIIEKTDTRCATVDESLRDVCERHKELGNPLGNSQPIVNLYHAEHQFATVVLISNTKPVYLLDKRKGNRLVKIEDPKVTSDKFWWNPGEVIRKFKEQKLGEPPPVLFYPYGPIAKGWWNNPKEWDEIGWRQSHCSYNRAEVLRVQDFEHGVIIGSVREAGDPGDAQGGRILVLLIERDADVGTWDFEPDARKPRCDPPFVSVEVEPK